MSAGPELRAYGANLNQAQANVGELRGVVEDVQDKLDTIEMVIDAIDTVERQADAFSDTVARMKLTLKLLDKASPLKVVATVGAFILDKVETVARKVEAQAHALAKRIDDSGLEKTLESAQDKLDNLDQGLRAVEGAIRHDAGVIKGMVLALDTVDALDPAGDPAATLAAGIEPLVALPNDAVGALNAAYAGIKAEVLALRDAVPEAGFLPVLGVRIAFDRIADSLAFLRGPLEVVGQILKPIEPILDAVGFVFDIFVRPVVDFLLETLGIRHIMDTAAARITGLLPNAGVFDEVLDDFDAAFREIDPLAALDDALGISGWIDQITTGLLDPVGNPQDGPLGIGTTGNDSLTGTAANDLLDAGAGDDTVSGGAGDDILLAGPGQDVLDGGSGQDTAVLRGNLVEYRFSIAGQGGDLVFDHLFPADPRISDGIETTRNIETYTFADLSLTHEQLLNGVRIAAAGQKLLSGTEGVDLLFAAGTAITIDGGSGDDVISGSPQNDTLRGGDGNDLIVRSGGNDAVDGGAGLDTWRYPTDNASGNPHVDADLQRGSVLIGGTTTTLVSIEAVVVQDERTAYLFGSAAGERLTSAAARDLLDGRGGDDLLDGGAGDDVLIGGPGADTLLGGAGSDALAAGESARAGVANFYDGGEGSDTLSYASDLREQVNREHFDTGLRNKARLQEASGPIRVHADSGLIERLSDDGLSVIATDTALGIERYIGSDFDDVLFGASGITVALDGGAGNDLLQGRGPGLLAGGAGDDLLFAAPGSSAQGGGGFDVLDLTAQAGVRWLVRLDGSIGSALRAFNAVDGNQLAVPGGSLQNESGPSVLGSGTVNDIDLYIGSDEDDYVELRSFGHITVRGGGGDDELRARGGGSSEPSFDVFGETGDDHLVMQEEGLADGGEGDDRIEVDADAGDLVRVQAGVGDDTVVLRGGVVALDGGEGLDILSAATSNAIAGLVLDLAAGTLAATGGSNRFTGTVTGFETVIGSNEHADTLRGSDAGETLIGAGANDRLEGRGGSDALYGGAGSDSLMGGGGDDWLNGGASADTIDGGAGVDTASFAFAEPGAQPTVLVAGSLAHIDADLAGGYALWTLFSGGSGSDALLGIENLHGGAGNDRLRGDAGPNLLAGGAGIDRLEGRGGDDVLVLEDDDTALGGDGDDRFVIGLGSVVIDGGAGTDVLDFGTLRGSVSIDVGAGRYEALLEVQRPVWREGGGSEPRSAAGVALTPQQVLEADPGHMNSLDDLSRVVPADPAFEIHFVTVVEPASGSFSGIEQFVGGAADLRLVGSAGNDQIESGAGNDALDGGAGLDAARFSGARGDYTLLRESGGDWHITDRQAGSDGDDALQAIERLQFADGKLALDLDGAAGSVARLLGAVFGPAAVANQAYAGIGLTLKDSGMSDEALAALAIEAAGAVTPVAIVELLWTHVVGTPPSHDEAAPFEALLAGGMSVGELGLLAAQHPLNEANIDLVGLVETGLGYV